MARTITELIAGLKVKEPTLSSSFSKQTIQIILFFYGVCEGLQLRSMIFKIFLS